MQKILLAAALVFITALIIYAAVSSCPRVEGDCTREWELVK